MLRRKIQVTAAEGIHLAVAAALRQISKKNEVHIFLKTGKRMVSVREMQKVLSLRIHTGEWVEIIVDGGQEEGIIEQIERLLHMG